MTYAVAGQPHVLEAIIKNVSFLLLARPAIEPTAATPALAIHVYLESAPKMIPPDLLGESSPETSPYFT